MEQYKNLSIVNLHCHSLYSCLDGFSTIEDIVDKSKEYGFAAASVTDHGCMDGCVPLYQECKKKEIKPILGEEFYITPEGKSLYQKDNDNRKRHHLIVVAKNEKGYRNLAKLSSIAFIDGRYYKPRIDLETLFKYKEGLIVSSACYASQLSYYLAEDGYQADTGQDGYQKAKDYCLKMQEEFGDDFYIEEVWLRPTGKKNPADKGKKPIVERQEYVNARATQLSKELGIKRIMTIDSHYTNKEDQAAHEVLVSVGTASDLDDPDRLSFIDIYEYIPTPEDMIKHAVEDLNDPDLVVNLEDIVNKVNIELPFIGKYHIPKFPCPPEFEKKYGENSEKEYLRYLVFQRIKEINYKGFNDTGKLPQEIIDRLQLELDTISKMGYNGYHLIVRDYVLWAKKNGVIVGPGRGSCISSLVCYLLGITSIDPMDYQDIMVFSRYLNPERASMPDIDMDFSDRQAVEDYFCEKWGKDKTAAIQTNLYMRAKNAFKDVARTLKYSFMDSQRIADMIPDIGGGGRKERRIPSLVKENEDIRKAIQEDPKLEEVFNYARQLEGTVRGHGVHACGVVVAPEPLNNYMGLATAQGDDSRVVTQASPDDIEGTFGLLKMDLLGLSNLTILNEAIHNIKKDLGVEIKLDELPQDDEETYNTYSEGDSYFTFQTNTSYVRSICKQYKPRNLRDLAWIVAVCRPGPMAFIPELLQVREGKVKPTYICDAAKEIFEPLGGKPIFQESVMLFSMKACGFTQGQADILRKAMAKTNNPASLESHRQEFVEGYLKTTNPNQRKEIEAFWDDLAGFARYSFNASHSVGYSLISYWTCYLLTHYPEHYLAAYMNAKQKDKDEIAEVLAYCKKAKIEITTPDVTNPGEGFVANKEKRAISYGLGAIKGVGASAKTIIEKMTGNNPPTNLTEFLLAFNRKELNAGKIKALINSGALDNLVKVNDPNFAKYGPRRTLIRNQDKIIEFRDKNITTTGKKEVPPMFVALGFEEPEPELELEIDKEPLTSKQKSAELINMLDIEKSYLGSYVSYDPLNLFERRNPKWKEQWTDILERESKGEKLYAGDKIIKDLVGRLIKKHQIMTKKGDPMAFLTFEVMSEDGVIPMEITVFPDDYKKIKDALGEKVFYRINVVPEKAEIWRAISKSISPLDV